MRQDGSHVEPAAIGFSSLEPGGFTPPLRKRSISVAFFWVFAHLLSHVQLDADLEIRSSCDSSRVDVFFGFDRMLAAVRG